MAKLPSLPNELLIAIFSYVAANVRAGHITATVGRVSKSFRQLIQSSGIDVLYTSLHGIDRMRTFLNLLAMATKREDDLPGLPLTLSVMEAILSTINTSRLHTLFIHVPICADEIPILHFAVPLHSLTDLRLSGLIAISPPGHPSYTPNVKHVELLHLRRLPDQHTILPRLIHNLAPTLTHLKVAIHTFPLDIFTDLLLFRDAVTVQRLGAEYLAFPRDLQDRPHAFPESLREVVVCIQRRPEYPTGLVYLLKKISDDLGETMREHGEAPAMVVNLPEEGEPDYISEEGEEDQGEALHLDCFVRSWMGLNVGEEVAWSEEEED
ncbi:hypothetical protein EIP91_008037 [Steccherinum ochraceum]|uniref:F-box domain-containing protein n=1 Tax=Steccherinum ochraceum TaxID=92696 RepID=A0A4R0R5Q4_9APHY|nr:hypothetical protein EIP91_008037 [Steccherinum ochraceum]